MNSEMKSQVADAIVKLHSMIPEISDYHEFAVVLESSIKDIFHLDWLQLARRGDDKRVKIVTSQPIPTDWEVYDIDTILIETFKKKIGETYLFELGQHPDKENEVYLLETVMKYTDASQFLTIHTAKTKTLDSCIGLYRTDKCNYFTHDEQQVLSYLSPVLVSVSHTMMLYYDFELKRVSHEQLSRSLRALTMTFDNVLAPVDIPTKTRKFLARYFPDSKNKTIPLVIDKWLTKKIAPKGFLESGQGPWTLNLHLPGLDLYLKAHTVVTGINHLVLLVMIYPHSQTVDFSLLQRNGFTYREVETLSFLPLGYTNRQIAIAMDIEEVTVKKHLKNCAQKLGTVGKTDTLYQALQRKQLLEEIGR